MRADDVAIITMDNNINQLAIVRNQGCLLKTGAISSEQFSQTVSEPLGKIVVTTKYEGEIVETCVDVATRNQMLEATDTLSKIAPEILPPNGKIDLIKDRHKIVLAYKLHTSFSQFYGALLSQSPVDVIEQSNMITELF